MATTSDSIPAKAVRRVGFSVARALVWRPCRLRAAVRQDIGEGREILSKHVQAEPDNRPADFCWLMSGNRSPVRRKIRGRVTTLQGAFELRNGLPGLPASSADPDVIRAMAAGRFLHVLGVRMDAGKTGDMAFTLNLLTPDNGERYEVELSNSTLTKLEGFQADDADLTLTIDRADLEMVMMGQKRLLAIMEDSTAEAKGDINALARSVGCVRGHLYNRLTDVPGNSRAISGG